MKCIHLNQPLPKEKLTVLKKQLNKTFDCFAEFVDDHQKNGDFRCMIIALRNIQVRPEETEIQAAHRIAKRLMVASGFCFNYEIPKSA